jgi:membrane-associated phospholipid phosphatase
MDPLKTRSLPGKIWAKVPTDIADFDEKLSEFLELTSANDSLLKTSLRFFTETPLGIVITIFGFLVVYFFLSAPQANRLEQLKKYIKSLFLLGFGLGLSDYSGSFLKMQFGRLKPHVNFYNPNAIPALSFPSNHAMNTAFFAVFFYFLHTKILSDNPKNFRKWKISLSFYFIFIAYSRVALGEHHVLDVLFGGLCGYILATIIKLILSFKLRNNLNSHNA